MSTASTPSAHAPEIARPRSIRWALARVEGLRLATHPIFVLGIVATTAQLAAAAGAGLLRPTVLFVVDVGGACAFLVMFLAASRERRDRAHDTYRAQPVGAGLRTEALLLSLGYAGLAGAALALALALSGLAPGTSDTAGGLQALSPLPLVESGLYFVLAGAIGVLVGSWTRRTQAAVLVALLLFVSPVAVSSSLTWGPLGPGDLLNVVLSGEGAIRNVIAAAGLAALAAAGALARHDRRQRIVALALAGLGAVAGLVVTAIIAVVALIVLLWPRSADLTPVVDSPSCSRAP
jgi:hypothetical protein